MPHPIGLFTRPQVASGGGGWTPASLGSDLVAWWDFSDTATITESGGSVSQVNDKSGNGCHLTQGTGANQPITGTRTLNGLNSLDFVAASNHYLSATLSGVSLDWTLWGVYNMDAYGNWGNPCFRLTHKNRGNIDCLDMTSATALSLSTSYLVQVSAADSLFPASPRNYMFINGSSEASGAFGGSPDITPFTISSNGDAFDGRWGECFITKTGQSTAHANATTYLSTKWGT